MDVVLPHVVVLPLWFYHNGFSILKIIPDIVAPGLKLEVEKQIFIKFMIQMEPVGTGWNQFDLIADWLIQNHVISILDADWLSNNQKPI